MTRRQIWLAVQYVVLHHRGGLLRPQDQERVGRTRHAVRSPCTRTGGWSRAPPAGWSLSYVVLIETWRQIVLAWGGRSRWPAAARIWFISNLGRYIPGKVWQIGAMGVLAQDAGVSSVAAVGIGARRERREHPRGIPRGRRGRGLAQRRGIRTTALITALCRLLRHRARLALAAAAGHAARPARRPDANCRSPRSRRSRSSSRSRDVLARVESVRHRVPRPQRCDPRRRRWQDLGLHGSFHPFVFGGYLTLFAPGGIGVREGSAHRPSRGRRSRDRSEGRNAIVIVSRLWITVSRPRPASSCLRSAARSRPIRQPPREEWPVNTQTPRPTRRTSRQRRGTPPPGRRSCTRCSALTLTCPALAGKFLVNPLSDQYQAGFAFRDFAAQVMKSTGGFPQWDPYLFGGMPYVAAMHGDIFYPTFLLRLILPTDVAMTWGMILHFFLCGLATYWFLRVAAPLLVLRRADRRRRLHDGRVRLLAAIGGARRQDLRLRALPGGIARADLGHARREEVGLGRVLARGGAHRAHPASAAAAVHAARLGRVGAVSRVRQGWARERLDRRSAIQRLALALGAVVVGGAIGAIQYLPVREYVSWSPRSAGFNYDTATSYSFPDEELINTYLPQFSGILAITGDATASISTASTSAPPC